MTQILVVPHDPKWAAAFTEAALEMAQAIGPNLVEVYHIGSTAIPGIYAKPIIDILAVVADITALDHRNAQMELIGYEAKGEFGIAGRRYFRRNNAEGLRTHQVHAFQSGTSDIQRHLAFRDFMRAHRQFARQYSELKIKLATAHPNDLEAYIDGKDGFIKAMEQRALEWVRAGKQPEIV